VKKPLISRRGNSAATSASICQFDDSCFVIPKVGKSWQSQSRLVRLCRFMLIPPVAALLLPLALRLHLLQQLAESVTT
jgi:hypothetical protein